MLEEEYQPRRTLPPHLRKPADDEAPFEYSMRDAKPADLPHIREIYNYYVRNSTVTFDTEAMTLAGVEGQVRLPRQARHAVHRRRVAARHHPRLRPRRPVEAEARLQVHRRELDLPRPGGRGQGPRAGAARRAHRQVEGGRPQGDHRGHRRPGRRCVAAPAREVRLQGDRAHGPGRATSSTAGSAPSCCRRASSSGRNPRGLPDDRP